MGCYTTTLLNRKEKRILPGSMTVLTSHDGAFSSTNYLLLILLNSGGVLVNVRRYKGKSIFCY